MGEPTEFDFCQLDFTGLVGRQINRRQNLKPNSEQLFVRGRILFLLTVFLVQDLINIVSPFANLEEDVFVIAALLQPFFHLLQFFLCGDSTQGLISGIRILVPSNGSAQIHIETTRDMVSHVLDFVLLADGIP